MRSPHAAHSRNGSVITHTEAPISVPPENRLHSTPGPDAANQRKSTRFLWTTTEAICQHAHEGAPTRCCTNDSTFWCINWTAQSHMEIHVHPSRRDPLRREIAKLPALPRGVARPCGAHGSIVPSARLCNAITREAVHYAPVSEAC